MRLIGKDAIINRELVQKIILINKIEYFDEDLFKIVNYYFKKKNNLEFEIIEGNRLIEDFE